MITAALPYANGPLHFGHIAGAYLPADAFARFMRLKGAEVLYICGTDEYGVAITLSAEKAKHSCQEHVDCFHQVIKDFFNKLAIQFDHFSRTTCKEHAPVVQSFFQELLENGHIEKRETLQLYSQDEDRFLADRYVVGTCPRCGFEAARGDECMKCAASYEATDLKSPRSKISGKSLILKPTTHYFLHFDHFKEELTAFLKKKQWKENVQSFAEKYVEEVRERAITRDLDWGVKVPLEDAEGKVFYVWFDAPIGYITASMEWANKQNAPEKWKDFWYDPKTKYVQFMGKDNIPFHAIFFPAMIMGQNQPYKQVDDLVANEFYNLEGRQFSKSEGWIIDLDDFFTHFHTDQIRYSIAASLPETKDADFSWKEFQKHCNQELLGQLGNFVNRVLVFAQNNCGAKVPLKGALQEEDMRFIDEMKRLVEECEESFKSYRLRKATQQIMALAHAANTYFDLKAPWKAAKNPNLLPMMEMTIYLCLNCIKVLALLAFPIIPTSAQRIWEMLGFKTLLEEEQWERVVALEMEEGMLLPKPSILFKRVEDELIDLKIGELKKMHEATLVKQAPPYAELKPQITIDDFDRLDLRVALILSAERVAKSKKLLKLEVDIGMEKRVVLSGISKHYEPEALVGKKVIVVANLAPAKLMGIESHGMVLAGSIDESLEIVTLEALPAGAVVS